MPPARLRALLDELRAADPNRTVFGSRAHAYAVQPAGAQRVGAFESRWGARLPDDVRAFLLEVTDGGAGPGYGMFPLERPAKRCDVSEDLRLLGQPFDEAFLVEAPPDVDPEVDSDAYDTAMDHYWRDMPGTMTLCHYGCAVRAQLVVTGRLAGQVLLDRRCDRLGVARFTRADHGAWNARRRSPAASVEPLELMAWYGDWLTASLDLIPR